MFKVVVSLAFLVQALPAIAASPTRYECRGEGNQLVFAGGELKGEVGDRRTFKNVKVQAAPVGTDIGAKTSACGDECPSDVHLTLPRAHVADGESIEFDTVVVLRDQHIPIGDLKNVKSWLTDRYKVFTTHCTAN